MGFLSCFPQEEIPLQVGQQGECGEEELYQAGRGLAGRLLKVLLPGGGCSLYRSRSEQAPFQTMELAKDCIFSTYLFNLSFWRQRTPGSAGWQAPTIVF